MVMYGSEIPAALEQALCHHFERVSDAVSALTHPSLRNEREPLCGEDYQRLEFLGDSILGMLLAEMLFELLPGQSEGELSRTRSLLAGQGTLALVARRLDIGRFILLGKGEEQCGGRDKDSILADVFEALLAAIYRDGGLDAARSLVRREFEPLLHDPALAARFGDAKSALQELLSSRGLPPPEYLFPAVSGPSHDPIFSCRVEVNGEAAGEGSGRSKKAAQQAAALQALELLKPR